MKVSGLARAEVTYSSAATSLNSWNNSSPAVRGGLHSTIITTVQGAAPEFYNYVSNALPSASLSNGMNKAQLLTNVQESRICGIQNATDISKADSRSVFASNGVTKSQTTSNSYQLTSQVPALTSFSGSRSDYSNQMGDFEKVDMKHSIALSDKPKSQEFSSSVKNTVGIASGRANGTMENVMHPPSSSTSDDDQQAIDERKQKRMLSNRESARRSRQRKQQHLEELREQLLQLRTENSQMLNKLNVVSQQFAQLSQENQFLRIHAMDLSQQLQRLNHNIVTQHPGTFNALDRDIGDYMPDTSTSSIHLSQL